LPPTADAGGCTVRDERGASATEKAEVAANVDDDAASMDGEFLLGRTELEKLGVEGGGAAQGAGDAPEDDGAVGGAEVLDEEGVVWGVGPRTEGGG
jgi:hypothetical protein